MIGLARGPLFKRALAWLAFLGPSFFLFYGWANWSAAHRPLVPSIAFDWERHIPFIPAFMLPYMSEDLIYGLSLFLVRSKRVLDRHAQRLLLVTGVCVACFFAYPLQFSFTRPPVEGFNGWLLTLLTGFDKPYNQAPSLHIALLVVLWAHYGRELKGWVWHVLRVWLVLIGMSVLFVWQHHILDVVLGLFVGFGALYVLPEAHSVRAVPRGAPRWHWKVGLPYLVGAVSCVALAAWGRGAAWILLWPALSLGLVAAGYLGLGARVFQKDAEGRRSLSARILLAPYLQVAAGVQRWLSSDTAGTGVGEIWVGPWPGPKADEYAVLDLAPELCQGPRPAVYAHLPLLDRVVPSPAELTTAVSLLQALDRSGRPLAVHCALGLERSVIVAAAWLWSQNREWSMATSIGLVKTLHPGARFSDEANTCLVRWSQGPTRVEHG